MQFLLDLFAPPQTRRQKNAAKAARKLREQAARDLSVEVHVLLKACQGAVARQQAAYSAGNHGLAGKFADALDGAKELLERIERVSHEIKQEVASRWQSASTASEWEAVATFELELREGFAKMKQQTAVCLKALSRAGAQSGGRQ